MKIVDVPADGSCMFHAISYAISKNFKHSNTLREHAIKYIYSNKEFFKDFIEGDIIEYLKKMRCKDTYGDNIMLVAISYTFDIQINIYDSLSFKLIDSYRNELKQKKIINILYDKELLHYRALVAN